MDKIKILYVIDYLTTGGGTENQLKALISHLDRERFEPFLVTLAPMKGWEGLPAYHDPGCEHICLGLRKIKHPKTIIDILRLSRLIRKRKFHIVQTFFVDANIIGVISGFLGGCRSRVVSRRDLGFWYTPPLLSFLNRVNRLARYFLVNSEAVKEAVMEHEKIEVEKIRVIRNGVFDMPDENRSKMRKADIGVPGDAPFVGIVANLREVKRIDNFIRVAAALRHDNTHFMVIGVGPLKEDLLRQAREAYIGHRFHITHTLDNIYDYIKLFDVGVLTSDSEGLSNTLIEYQLCGIPAIAFDVGGNNEVIEQGNTGFLIKHGDLDEMRSKIDILLDDEDLRARLGHKARDIARARFAGERMIKETAEFYEMIAGRR